MKRRLKKMWLKFRLKIVENFLEELNKNDPVHKEMLEEKDSLRQQLRT